MSRQDWAEKKDEATRVAATNLLTRTGAQVEQLDRWITEVPDGEHFITSIAFKVRYKDVGDILVIVKADGPDGKVIAFHSEMTMIDALTGIAKRLNARSLKWKVDTPYDERDR